MTNFKYGDRVTWDKMDYVYYAEGSHVLSSRLRCVLIKASEWDFKTGTPISTANPFFVYKYEVSPEKTNSSEFILECSS